MSNLIETLTTYVPALVAQRLAGDPSPILAPDRTHFSAAVLYADITGFTPLTEKLAQEGPQGTDKLSELLNTFFGQLIDLVIEHGGDIVTFAGDALIAVWSIEASIYGQQDLGLSEDEQHARQLDAQELEALQESTLRAVQCALRIQAQLQDFQSPNGEKLAMQIGISAGSVYATHLGGKYGRWEFLLAGAPLEQVSVAEDHADPGQTLIAAQAWELVEGRCTGTPLESGEVCVISVDDPVDNVRARSPILSAEAETSLRAYIPGTIMSRLAAGQSGWLAELRRVTVLFVNLTDLNYQSSLSDIQNAIHMLQEALYRFEGSVSKIAIDEKGIVFIAALGLHPLAHEDDPTLGTLAAMEMRDRIRPLEIRCAIGVATGRIFCGSIGNSSRREYALIGDAVNLASRLMEAASLDLMIQSSSEEERPLCQILVDAETHEMAQMRVTFEELSPIQLKGRTDAEPIFQPLSEKKFVTRRVAHSALFGRNKERTRLADALQRLVRGIDNVIMIEGEAGIGKTQLVQDLVRQASALDVKVFIGAGDTVERQNAYHAWRSVISQYFDIPTNTPAEVQKEKVLDMLSVNDEWLRLAPLLKDVLQIDLPENHWTSQMKGQVRADNTRDLMLKLIQHAASLNSLVIVLEDAHWMDSSSWALAQSVVRQVHPLLLVFAFRPFTDAPPEELVRLTRSTKIEHILLQPLSEADIRDLIRHRLGVESVPEPVAKLILTKGEGNPFFSEELAYALRDSGIISVVNGACVMAENISLKELSIPDTVEGVVTSRIDRLEPAQQMILKIASVIGKMFNRKILQDVYPIEGDKPHLQEHLNSLKKLDLANREDLETESIYSFKHTITQEVAYNLMAFGQRRELHRSVAAWYEKTYGDLQGDGIMSPDSQTAGFPIRPADTPLAPYLPLMVHHYHQAGDQNNERYYAKLAGKHAASQFANAEAVDYLSRALELTPLEQTAERFDLILSREYIYDLQGRREEQLKDLLALTQVADSSDAPQKSAVVALRLANYYEVIGDYQATIIAARNALKLVQSLNAPDLQATAHLHWGRALNQLGDYRYARDHLDTALSLVHAFSKSARDSYYPKDTPEAYLYPIKAESLRWLGEVSWNEGDLAEAKYYYERSLNICRETGDRRRECYLLDHLGFVSWSQDDLSRARSYYIRALEIFQEIGDRQGEGSTLNHLGSVAERQREYSTAISYYRQALDIFREIGFRRGEAEVFVNLGFVSYHQVNYLASKAYLNHALFTFREIGLRRGETLSLVMLALVAMRLEEKDEALDFSLRGIEIAQELGDRGLEAYGLTHLGHLQFDRGELAKASDSYYQAYKLRLGLKKQSLAMESLSGLVRVLMRQGNLPEAYIQVETILKFLVNDELIGTLEPFWVYWTCYMVLDAFKDPRRARFLEGVYKRLNERAAKITKENLRRTFLEEIPHHQQIVLTWENENRS